MQRVIAAALLVFFVAGCGGDTGSEESTKDTGTFDGETNVPDDAGGSTCESGETRSCYSGDPATSGVGVCTEGQEVCGPRGWGECNDEVTPAEEVCDALDNDCDGTIDEGCLTEQVANYGDYGCAIDEGELFCFGRNDRGALGVGEEVEVTGPEQVGTDAKWEKVAASDDQTCGILNGSLWCWGTVVEEGAGGNVTTAEHWEPHRLSTEEDWSDVSLGLDFGCGLRAGELWCWGRERALNDNETRRIPTRIGERRDWTDIDVGGNTVCGVAGGAVYCWGDYLDEDVAESQPSRVGDADDWHRVAVTGRNAQCGLKVGGALYCWGAQTSFERAEMVGETPVAMGEEEGFWELAAGGGRFCALRGDEAWCLGRNDGRAPLVPQDVAERKGLQQPYPERSFQTIGPGIRTCGMTSEGFRCWGRFDPDSYPGDPDADAYRMISDAESWEIFESGHDSSCGIAGGDLYCWGRSGNLGLDLEPFTGVAIPTLVDDTREWTDLAVYNTKSYGIADGQVYKWGGSVHEDAFDASPTLLDPSMGWTAVDGVESRTCGLRSGEIHCWTERNEEVSQVGTESDWSYVSAGVDHSCAIQNGELYCWGDNSSGQLGTGSTSEESTPTRVGAETDWTAVDAGDNATCGLRGSDLYCWGLGPLFDRRDDVLSPRRFASDVTVGAAPNREQGLCYSTADAVVCNEETLTSTPAASFARHVSDGLCLIDTDNDLSCAGENSNYRWGQIEPHMPIAMPLR